MNGGYKKLNLWYIIALISLLVFALSTYSWANQRDGLLKVYFLDVGQGDSIFIESPTGDQVLIDGGPDNKVLEKLGKYMPINDRSIDLVISTHKHADHISGLLGVLDRYDVQSIIDTKENDDSAESRAWDYSVKKEGAKEIEAIAGDFVDLGDGVVLKILYPFESLINNKASNENNNSVVMMLEYKNVRLLLTGDIEATVENKLIANGVDLTADVIKVAHHGSKTSSTESFLTSVGPQVGFIEVGENNIYKLPSQEILSRLEKFGIKYYRSDTDGDVELVSDGINFKIIKN